MPFLPVTLEELMEVVRTCAFLEIERCTPTYLQEFIATRLAERLPNLAATVRRLDTDRMNRLCAYIQATYGLIR
jgi:hypothetical protein